MKNSWLIWIFIVAVIITVFIAFNYENGKKTDSLSEIFPDETTQPVDIEYEFADKNAQVATPTITQAAAPAVTATTTQAAAAAIAVKATQEAAAKAPAAAPATATATQTAVAQAPAATSGTAYTIQVASYNKENMAQDFADKLKAKNFESYVGSRTVNDKTYYRVYVGKYDSKQEAQTALNEVQKEYQTSFIISPKK